MDFRAEISRAFFWIICTFIFSSIFFFTITRDEGSSMVSDQKVGPLTLVDLYGNFETPPNIQNFKDLLTTRVDYGLPAVTPEESDEILPLLRREYHPMLSLLEPKKAFETQREILTIFLDNGGVDYLISEDAHDKFVANAISDKNVDAFRAIVHSLPRPDEVKFIGSTLASSIFNREANSEFANILVFDIDTDDIMYWEALGNSVGSFTLDRLPFFSESRVCLFASYSRKISKKIDDFDRSSVIFNDLFSYIGISSFEELSSFVKDCSFSE